MVEEEANDMMRLETEHLSSHLSPATQLTWG